MKMEMDWWNDNDGRITELVTGKTVTVPFCAPKNPHRD